MRSMLSGGEKLVESDDEVDEAYAEVTSAMEDAFIKARQKRPHLSLGELFVSLLLLKDRIIEQHLPIDTLPPELVDLAQQLYNI